MLLLGGIAALTLGILGLTLSSINGGFAVFDRVRPVPAVPARPWEGHATGQVKEFKLTIGRLRWELGPGKAVEAYGFNGRVPGPELRVQEGDTVRVTVTNQLLEPTTVHWHGVEVPVQMDGVPNLSQKPIPPGGTFTYEFVAIPGGTRWYHSHFNELDQQGNGLVGPLIIEPHQPASPQPDREYVLMTQDWRLAGAGSQSVAPVPSPSGGSGMMGGMTGSVGHRPVDTFSINGKAYPNGPPLTVRKGERVRLRLINGSGTETQVFALAGHKLTVTSVDGNRLARPVEGQAVRLGVGERADVEFLADTPGRWQLRGLLPGQADRGLAADVVYQGHEADAVQTLPPGTSLRPLSYADLPGPAHVDSPNRTYELALSGGMMGSGSWTINGKSYPKTDQLAVRPGERVRLKLFNMSMEDHPMHLHGHTFQLVAIRGQPVSGPLKDTLTVRPMEEYEIEFTANNPGAWLFHCHNLEHMTGGLMTEVHYR